MVELPSNMMPLGTDAPDFSLPDTVSGKQVTLQDVKSEKGTLVMFICNHCPYVVHVQDQLVQVAKDYAAKGIGFVAISSNDAVNYPADGPENMKTHAEEQGFPFPYLYDESQAVAKAYDAACTPDFFLFDGNLKCVYRGQLDNARPGNDQPVDGHSLRAALDALVAGESISPEQKPSAGCSIKWKD